MKKTNVTVACCALLAPLAFCASAFAGPSENVVLPAKQQSAQRTVNKVYYVVTAGSAIPQPCDRLAAIPTTATPMKIFGHHATTR
jgi:hypothetical protein